MTDLQYGVSIWPQYTTWEALRDTALRAEELGYETVWVWDHFLPIVGDPGGPNLECWTLLSALGALTRRVRLGALVCGNTYRHPAVLANMAAALDHVTAGRAILGMGAGWNEREHAQYGLDFHTVGGRLDRLAEAAAVARSLLDQPTTTFDGRFYQLRDARCEPKPVQARLPLMIGGGGEKKTLLITARHADLWNVLGMPLDGLRHKLEVLRGHCRDVGRDAGEIMPTVLLNCIVRDTPEGLEERRREIAETNRLPEFKSGGPAGNPEAVALAFAEHYRLGIRGILLSLSAPHDLETLERVAREVRPRVEELIAANP